MSSFCVTENVGNLRAAIKKKEIFSASLEESIFKSVLEILWNIGRAKSKCKKCFSKKSIRGLKKYRTIVKKLLKTQKSVEKRKKLSLNAPSSFRRLILRILKEFVKNCTEVDKERD